ncbi:MULTISPECIES: hypothetical protein [Cyanophyceae]|uniref:hypothetical protein n=1 Tax=Cyanophyceae TaxID=3028117 RepID=UPI00074D2964|nr:MULTISPECIES: hypothetical protein [Cyanophyceae]MBF2085252.1 hypothetical protein [Thermoleptolyngbya sp. C42_A2020_037]BAU42881.1 hypothetical protein O77CONTIG1_02703 [Leptolyngbya sp. O-77]
MTYQERLNSWLVVHLRPDYRWAIAARFHRRSDADGYAQLLRQRSPGALFWVVFDSTSRQKIGQTDPLSSPPALRRLNPDLLKP